MAAMTIDLADAMDALTGIGDAALSEYHGTLHVYLPSAAAYGAFAAALAARLTGHTRVHYSRRYAYQLTDAGRAALPPAETVLDAAR